VRRPAIPDNRIRERRYDGAFSRTKVTGGDFFVDLAPLDRTTGRLQFANGVGAIDQDVVVVQFGIDSSGECRDRDPVAGVEPGCRRLCDAPDQAFNIVQCFTPWRVPSDGRRVILAGRSTPRHADKSEGGRSAPLREKVLK
jgi:hypothetical protein